MTETQAPYLTTPTVRPQNGVAVVLQPPQVDPRLRALLLIFRRAAYMVGDGIGEYLGLAKR
jgi:hypothetical protein